MLGLLARRSADTSICPSEVARALHVDDWRACMPVVREVAARLATQGVVSITQADSVIDPDTLGHIAGPIRLRRGACFDEGDPGDRNDIESVPGA